MLRQMLLEHLIFLKQLEIIKQKKKLSHQLMIYGSAKYIPIDEKHSLNAQSPYAASKIAADQISLSYFRLWNSTYNHKTFQYIWTKTISAGCNSNNYCTNSYRKKSN